MQCQRCGNSDSNKFIFRGKHRSGNRRFKCKVCGKWGCLNGNESISQNNQYNYTFDNNGETAELSFEGTDDDIRTEKDLFKRFPIDENEWQVERIVRGKSTGYRKDRSVEWKVRDGQVEYGEVHDSGKLLIKPFFSIKVFLKRKTQEIRNKLAIDDLKSDLKNFAVSYPKIKYPKTESGMLFEIEVPDLHIGKLTWEEESGESSDLKLQSKRAIETLTNLLAHARNYPIEKILFPIGNDYFNVDNQFNTTSHGTPQQEDTRWRKTFRVGRTLAIQMIDLCACIAPVDVLIVPGNHDEERSFYLGDALECWYHTNSNVHIDNSAQKRKYYLYGKLLLGLTHGYHEKLDKLQNIMPVEAPEMWAKSKFREWHTGDKHHRVDAVYKTNEQIGVVVRILRSLSPNDAWHYDKGYVGALRASEAFLWDREQGLIAQFTSVANYIGEN